jgi:hypothetical protein
MCPPTRHALHVRRLREAGVLRGGYRPLRHCTGCTGTAWAGPAAEAAAEAAAAAAMAATAAVAMPFVAGAGVGPPSWAAQPPL